jgi:hypothetical protein
MGIDVGQTGKLPVRLKRSIPQEVYIQHQKCVRNE